MDHPANQLLEWLTAVTVAATAVIMMAASPAMAADATVTGVVVDSGGTAQPGISVEALPAGTTTVRTTTITNDRGEFSLVLPPDAYDLQFTPPATSGLQTYVASNVDAGHTAPLTVVLKPITVVRVQGLARTSQGWSYSSGTVQFLPVPSGPSTPAQFGNNGAYTAELLSGQYRTSISGYANYNPNRGIGVYTSLNFTNPISLNQDQTYDLTVPTSALTISVRDVNGAPVTDAGIRYDFSSVSTPAFSGFTFTNGVYPMDAAGNAVLNVPTGTTPASPAIVLNSGLIIPITIGLLDRDRHLYLIFDRVTGNVFIDDRPPVVTARADRAPNVFGWYNAPVTVTWSSVDPAPSSGAPSTPAPVVAGAEGAGQVITSEPSCDPAGNCVSGHYTVSLDRTPPVITATAAPEANANEWHDGATTVMFTCSDALSGVASCPAPVTVNADTAGQTVTGTAVDKAGNTAVASAVVKVDATAPTITAVLSQAANGDGWNNGDVTVTFTCTDSLSGIAACPQPVTLTDDGPNQTVSGTAVDRAGNSATVAVTVSIDKTKPLITATRTPANDNGWNNGLVTVAFACADAVSGIASCPAPSTLTAEGAGQSVSGTAVSRSGNAATATVADINIDTTAPTITAAVVGTKNAAGWYRTPPTVRFTCADSRSGIDRCPADIVVDTSGAGQTVSGTVVDKAGNTATVTVTDLNVDLAAPAVAVTGAVNGANYPLNQIPSPACATTDAISGVAAPAVLTLTRTDSGGYTATCAGAADIAGNTTLPVAIAYTVTPTATSLGDLTGQFVTASGSPNANGVVQDLRNKLLHGQICLYVAKVDKESQPPNATLTAAQAAELVYWARVLDPSC